MDIKKTFTKDRVLMLMKQTQLVLLLFVLSFALILVLPQVRGSYVVAGVKTRINLDDGFQSYDFFTYKTSLEDAIRAQGIALHDQDSLNLPRQTNLKGGELKVALVRSWPVLINDDGQIIKGRTVYHDPNQILEQNGVKVWPEDLIGAELILNPIKFGGAGQLVTIRRAPVYYVSVDGKLKEVRSWDRNVRTIIERSATKLNPNDIVAPALVESVSNGSTIKITRINYADVSKEETIPFDTIYQGSTSLALGREKVSQVGVTGAKTTVYRITYKDGEEVSRKVISSTVTKQKRDSVVLRGAEVGRANFGYYKGMVTSFHNAKASMVGKYLLVTNLANGKSVKVRIIGNGPFNGPLMDMGTEPFQAIGGSLRDGYLPKVMVQLLD